MSVFQLRTQSTPGLLRDRMNRATQGAGVIFEAVHRRDDGSVFPVEVSSHALMIKGRGVLLCVVRDISERVSATDMLIESEERYRKLFDQAQDGVFIAYESGLYIDVNESGCRIFGASRDWIIGRPVGELATGDDLDLLRGAFSRLDDRLHLDRDWHFVRPGGTNSNLA